MTVYLLLAVVGVPLVIAEVANLAVQGYQRRQDRLKSTVRK
jgi:hypothetical protein